MKCGLRNFDWGICYQQENKSQDYFQFESCFKRERAYLVIKTGSAYELILVQVRKNRVWDSP